MNMGVRNTIPCTAAQVLQEAKPFNGGGERLLLRAADWQRCTAGGLTVRSLLAVPLFLTEGDAQVLATALREHHEMPEPGGCAC